ncbi:hypothetical protein BOTBODRAFT_32517 [Botryobasidium botryosum FD-172 SS1]|uniref:Cytochrome P450 n=1 Tax=Botryobasidium botryosum (strain FD-172 SS1) TaxID=930990 RepID=A0A067MSD6_BOTB1|nr:hypothetical protein BOTBODRAFT_32517 [Botryobasidium botryosum FD-172 SS1]
MSGLNLHLVAVLLVTISAVVIYRRHSGAATRNPGRLPYPPGPKPHPLVGHALLIPSESSWITFLEWKKIYGDIIHLRALSQNIIVLNSYKVARDLIGKRHIYASRPAFPMVGELMGWARIGVLTPYNETLKRYRKLIHPMMSRGAVKRYVVEQRTAVIAFLETLVNEPHEFHRNSRFTAGKMIMSTIYGIKVDSADDEYITISEAAMAPIVKVVYPGAAYVNIFPVLKYVPSWFPGAQFKRNAKIWRKLAERMVDHPFESVKSAMAARSARPSFTSILLQEENASEEDIKWVSGTLYAAGADTTAAVLATFILAMTIFPEAQKKAQQEIDRVIGSNSGRLPTLEDREDLPYVESIWKETLRWLPVTPLGAPHLVTEDDTYGGYYIPAQSTVLANIWAMSRDETTYADPDRFWPERYEGEKGKDVLDPRLFVFGFGRRTCAGAHFAESSLFMAISCILATFDISKARDEQGQEIEPEISFTAGLINHVNPFKCDIRPRSAQAIALIRSDH